MSPNGPGEERREPGALLATGRSAEVRAWGADRVVKLFLPGHPDEEIRLEQEHCTEAFDLGLTTVRCHGTVTIGDRTGLVLDRVTGESLTRVAERNPLLLRRSARVLARLQAEMHERHSDTLPEVRESVVALLDTPPLAFLSAEERTAAAELVLALPDGSSILHLDFHSENVFVTADGRHEIIDWPTARRGAPAADIAASIFLLRDAELWPGTPPLKKLVFNIARRSLCAFWLAEYVRLTGMPRAEIDRWRLPALVLRLGLLDVPSERQRLAAEIRQLLTEVTP
ncbi:phosphotransferase [Nocardioides pacificus]